MNKLERNILLELLNHQDPITSEKLAMQLGVSSKTIRRYLQELKEVCLQFGAVILIKPAIGITLNITDEKQFNAFLNENRDDQLPNTPDERTDYLLNLLLFTTKFHKVNNIADELFISPSRLGLDLKNLREFLKKYDLEIENKPNYGIRIQGGERNKRICMADIFSKKHQFPIHDSSDEPQDKFHIVIDKIITKVLVSENIRMSDLGVQSLAIHILIAIERIETGNIIVLSDEVNAKLRNRCEYQTAIAINEAIKKTFSVELPESEIGYLTQQLLGKKHFDVNTDTFNIEVTDEVAYLVNVILRSIFDNTKIDFYNDLDLKMNLILHMIPFLERTKNKMMVKNPIINDIKEKYSFAYELASIGLSNVCAKIKTKITEDEISFFALHFILALERKNEEIIPSNILIVCSTGRATSQLLAYQIQKKFGPKINTIKIIEAHMIGQITLDSYDYIFSTVPLPKEISVPIRRINSLLDERDFALIETCLETTKRTFNLKNILQSDLFFTDLIASNAESAINELIKRCRNVVNLPSNFYDLVLERESFASTELNNLVAIPHPNQTVSETTFIAVGILKKPILWKKKQVQILFLISLMPNNKQNIREFYEGLVEFVSKEKNTLELIHNQTYETMLSLIEGN